MNSKTKIKKARRKGGLTTLRNHGRKHFSEIAKKMHADRKAALQKMTDEKKLRDDEAGKDSK